MNLTLLFSTLGKGFPAFQKTLWWRGGTIFATLRLQSFFRHEITLNNPLVAHVCPLNNP
jgi:hypothetical protein